MSKRWKVPGLMESQMRIRPRDGQTEYKRRKDDLKTSLFRQDQVQKNCDNILVRDKAPMQITLSFAETERVASFYAHLTLYRQMNSRSSRRASIKFTSVLVHKYKRTNVAGVISAGDRAKLITTNDEPTTDLKGYIVVRFEVVPCSFQHNPKLLKDPINYSTYPSPIKCDSAVVAMPIKEGQPLTFS
ncbi:hypothetical protein M9H77_13650 [Catharanthus roseus]|uniref:Uncharacterized protein n=1 Tax=Catharanthus roseus TaxID=4058 RepID=A0ACC0BL15_CATRO|nr:hypothetical protein M9H77_13650 [Catharanthus roseus]